MTTNKILTYAKKVMCKDCTSEFTAFFQATDEGFGQAAQLYECSNCKQAYYHSIEEERYLGALSEKIKNTNCVVCNSSLSEKLKKVNFVGSCSKCKSKSIRSIGKSCEYYLEAISIYQ